MVEARSSPFGASFSFDAQKKEAEMKMGECNGDVREGESFKQRSKLGGLSHPFFKLDRHIGARQ